MSVNNHVQYMSTSAHGHQSNYQGQTERLRHEGDIERRIQARIAKDGVRIREFFIDFDKLRKGVVGEAAVSDPLTVTERLLLTEVKSEFLSNFACLCLVPHLHRHSRCCSY